METGSIKETHQLSKELGEDIHYKSFQHHFKNHVDLRTDYEKKLDQVRGYAVKWAKENETTINYLQSYAHILQQFQTTLQRKAERGELIKDYPRIAREIRGILKDLDEYQQTLAESPLVSKDMMYQIFLQRLDVLCHPCRVTLLDSFEKDLQGLTSNTDTTSTNTPT